MTMTVMAWCTCVLALATVATPLAVITGQDTVVFTQEDQLRHDTHPETDDPDKVWLFAVDGIKRPYAFMDQYGDIVGFDVDIVNAVCKVAEKKCAFVLAAFTECVFSQRGMTFPGRGLMAGWFDACPGFAITQDRVSTFDFTEPYLATVATFTVAPGNPQNFQPGLNDYSNYTLMHLNGAPTNERCMNRLGKKYGPFKIARDLPDAKQALLNGTVTAVFSPRTHIDGLQVLGPRLHCEIGGAGILTKKGSKLASWWNPAYTQVFNSGNYTNICNTARAKFNYDVKCLNSPPPVTRASEWETWDFPLF